MTEQPKGLPAFNPADFVPSPEEAVAAAMKRSAPQVRAAQPSERFTVQDVQAVAEALSRPEGFTDLAAANRAARVMFAQSSGLLELVTVHERSVLEARGERNAIEGAYQALGLALRELCALIDEGDASEDVIRAAGRVQQLADTAAEGVREYDGNMLNAAINLRALAHKGGPLRGLGREQRERIIYLTQAAAAILDDARVNLLAAQQVAKQLMQENETLRTGRQPVPDEPPSAPLI